jgi:tetratricopeptide (TPR) repeat protein
MKKLLYHITLLFTIGIVAQSPKDFNLPKANAHFLKNQYADAEAQYRISKSNNPKKATSAYNLGNSIYKQNQPSEAKFAYANALELATGKIQKHRAYHNIGNVFMTEKAYDKAVEAYKNALRNNPLDDQTRYNYALAKKMLKEHPPQEKNQDKNPDKNPNQDKKEKPQNKPQNQPNNTKDNPNKLQQNKANQEQAKNLLEAVNNEEKKVQDKINNNKTIEKPIDNAKDW